MRDIKIKSREFSSNSGFKTKYAVFIGGVRSSRWLDSLERANGVAKLMAES